jgi:hypothetical protein
MTVTIEVIREGALTHMRLLNKTLKRDNLKE